MEEKGTVYKPTTAKEAIKILLSFRDKGYRLMVQSAFHFTNDDDHYQPIHGSVPVSRDWLVKELKNEYGMFTSFEKEREDGKEKYLRVHDYGNLVFIG